MFFLVAKFQNIKHRDLDVASISQVSQCLNHHELSILRISLWCWWPFRVQVGHPLRAAPAAAFLQEGPQRRGPTQFWSSLVVDLMALDALDGTGALPTERD